MILLALVIAALLGSGIRNVIIALSVAMMPGYARVMCGQVLSVKENDYVTGGPFSRRQQLTYHAPPRRSQLYCTPSGYDNHDAGWSRPG